jgi:hypothetical protein
MLAVAVAVCGEEQERETDRMRVLDARRLLARPPGPGHPVVLEFAGVRQIASV